MNTSQLCQRKELWHQYSTDRWSLRARKKHDTVVSGSATIVGWSSVWLCCFLSICIVACVRVREEERERESVCVCVCMCVCVCECVCAWSTLENQYDRNATAGKPTSNITKQTITETAQSALSITKSNSNFGLYRTQSKIMQLIACRASHRCYHQRNFYRKQYHFLVRHWVLFSFLMEKKYLSSNNDNIPTRWACR